MAASSGVPRLRQTVKKDRAMESLDSTHVSRKAWKLSRHLGGATSTEFRSPNTRADNIAAGLLINSMTASSRHTEWAVRSALRNSRREYTRSSPLFHALNRKAIGAALSITKAGKVTVLDDIYPDMLKNMDPNGSKWFVALFTTCSRPRRSSSSKLI